ncbi:GSU2403 family nucleotidyltransferase fold protein [Pacificimonas flava]|uniref:Nucleotidyltransferase-like domain-containing protein n=1 Tax=Pacificimonas flava TaxID=1234595 RepID=M2S9H1_9SPHN|nr:GSU2403 family nucleotidyltransferase fold protein [Pacificimonas flava]EMD82040.1 hypothetical protein C725_2528 [Pacificimonas flava]MBB5280881.1 hypothetical protein [Pacificimonas flava]
MRAFSQEQSRTLVNLRTRYEGWMDAQRAFAALPYDLRRKKVGGASYLYEITGRDGNGKSLGRMDEALTQRFEDYRTEKAALKDRMARTSAAVAESAALARALRLPMIANLPGAILRAADERGMLDGQLLVVGTNALPAYMAEAAALIDDAPLETEDFDLAWAAGGRKGDTPEPEPAVWPMLKSVDTTFTVNSERGFQARNADAYEVELLAAPSTLPGLPRRDQPRPVPLAEQEWLLMGRPVDQVLPTADRKAARIVAPDPRYFALMKLWLAEKPGRDRLKVEKDRMQGAALLVAIREAMPHYPMDDAFREDVPAELKPYLP